MFYDYTGIINFMDSEIKSSKENVIAVSENIAARSDADDFYFADLAESLALNDSIISYLSEIKSFISHNIYPTPIQIAQKVLFDGSNYDLAKDRYAETLMKMLVVIDAKID